MAAVADCADDRSDQIGQPRPALLSYNRLTYLLAQSRKPLILLHFLAHLLDTGGVSVRRPYRHRRLQWSAGEHDPHRHVENRRHHAARSRLTLPLTIGIAAGLFYILER
jgi:hypothetical protein